MGERWGFPLYDDRLQCYLGPRWVLRLPQIYAPKGKRRGRCIDYRHVIGSLKKKPMAFYRSRLRDDLLPSADYRCIWEVLQAHLEPRSACRLMVGVLALAAEYDCEQSWGSTYSKPSPRKRFPASSSCNGGLVGRPRRFQPNACNNIACKAMTNC